MIPRDITARRVKCPSKGAKARAVAGKAVKRWAQGFLLQHVLAQTAPVPVAWRLFHVDQEKFPRWVNAPRLKSHRGDPSKPPRKPELSPVYATAAGLTANCFVRLSPVKRAGSAVRAGRGEEPPPRLRAPKATSTTVGFIVVEF
jgi:hypothetical protein